MSKLYEREEKVLKKQIKHTLLLESLRSRVYELLREGEFKFRVENSRKGKPRDPETIDLCLSFGKDNDPRAVLPIVKLSTSMTAKDVAKLLELDQIVKDCEDADVVCSDTEIILTKVIDTEEA